MNQPIQKQRSSSPTFSKSIILKLLSFTAFAGKYILLFYRKIETSIAHEMIIQRYYRAFKIGKISEPDRKKYIQAVLKNRGIEKRSRKLLNQYRKYLQDDNPIQSLTAEQIMQLIKAPDDYLIYTKSQLQDLIDIKIKQAIPDLMTEEKENLVQALLPFTTDESEYVQQQIGWFERQDFQRIKLYTQMQKGLELDERELVAKFKDMEQLSKAQFLEAKEEKINAQQEGLNVQQQKLQALQIQLENQRTLLQIESQKQELDYKIRFIELSNLSMQVQQQQNDIHNQKKEFEVLQLLHDYEMKNRALHLSHNQQMLSLKEQGLENELKLKQAEFLTQMAQQQQIKLEIESQLIDLKEGTFLQKVKEIFLDIKNQKIELREQRIDHQNILEEAQFQEKENRLEQKNLGLVQRFLDLKRALFTQEQKESFLDMREKSMDLKQQEQNIHNTIAAQDAKIMKEKAFLEKQQAKLLEQQRKMHFNMSKIHADNYFLRMEKSHLMRELKAKPKVIYKKS